MKSLKWLTLAFGALIILIAVFADLGELGPLGVVYDFPFGDKAGHILLYGIMTLLLDLTFIQALPQRDPKLVVIATGLIFALLIAAEEFSQKYFPFRTFSLLDLSASYLGIIFFSWLALKIKQ